MTVPDSPNPTKHERPTIDRKANSFYLEWPVAGYRAKVSHIHESARETRGEILWHVLDSHDHWGRLHQSRMDLLSVSGQAALAKTLQSRSNGIQWNIAIEQLCQLVVDAYRQGEPLIDLWDHPGPGTMEWLVPHLLPKNETSVWFGDGGSDKSMLAMSVAASVRSGLPWLGRYKPTETGPVLYLDWETNPAAHTRRLHRIADGLGLPDARGILYRRMSGSVVEAVDQLAEIVAERGVVLAIVDSLGWACADDLNENRVAIQAMTALRELHTTNLVIAHISKGRQNQRGAQSTIFGSAFFSNAARCSWEVKVATDNGDWKLVQLRNAKMNDERLEADCWVAVQFEQSPGPITFTYTESAALNGGQPARAARDDILDALQAGPMTIPEVAAHIATSEKTTASAMQRLVSDGKVRKVEPKTGTRAFRYVLADEHHGLQPSLDPEDPTYIECKSCDLPAVEDGYCVNCHPGADPDEPFE